MARSTLLRFFLFFHSRQDQEDGRQDQVQGALQQVPVHAVRHGLGQGGQAQAVPTPGPPGAGHLNRPNGFGC